MTLCQCEFKKKYMTRRAATRCTSTHRDACSVNWPLHHNGILPVFVNLIQQLYDNATCQEIHNRKLTEPFEVKTSVRLCCLILTMIFMMVIDWVMRETTLTLQTISAWCPRSNSTYSWRQTDWLRRQQRQVYRWTQRRQKSWRCSTSNRCQSL